MKRTVYNTVIGLMLVGGLTMISTAAMAQGRRPATSNNAAAAGNRSVATAPQKSAAVSNNVSSAAPSHSVSSRPTSGVSAGSSSSSINNGGNRSASAGNRSSSSGSAVRPSNGVSNGSSVSNGHSGNNGSSVRPGNSGSSVRPGNSGSNGGNVGTGHGNNNSGNSLRPNGPTSGSARPSTGSSSGHVAPPANRPAERPSERPRIGGTVMAGGSTHIDYNTYRYNSSWRPRYDGDPFFTHYRYNSWSWSSPIRPSVRPMRPLTMWVYRPTVTVNVGHYSSYPTIAGVLGLKWGTSFGNSLNYLYYNGYYIDGFMDNIVYLTDVELLDYGWDDVMIKFDRNNRLDYVEFSYWTNGYDTSRFFSLYNDLCILYGAPVIRNNSMFSWYGGDGVGFVNLGIDFSTDVCYTVLAFGI